MSIPLYVFYWLSNLGPASRSLKLREQSADCWQSPSVLRDADNRVACDPLRFPAGIKHLADFVHDHGALQQMGETGLQAPLRTWGTCTVLGALALGLGFLCVLRSVC
jgi:hypothetical protein